MLIEVPYGTGRNRYVISARTRIGFDAGNALDNGFTPDPLLKVPGVNIQKINGEQPTLMMLSRPNGDSRSADGVFVAGQSFQDPENGSFTAATAGSNFDTAIGLFRPSDRAPLPPKP